MTRLEDLRVWQTARGVVREVREVTEAMRDACGLRDQMRRAAVSMASNIAEGAGRGSDAELRRFLEISRGSATELHAQLGIAADCGFIDEPTAARLGERVDHVMRMLSAFIIRLKEGG